MKQLVAIAAVRVEHRYDGAQRLTNACHVRTRRPGRTDAARPTDAGSRGPAGGPGGAAVGGRTGAGRVAASAGQDPEHLTQSTTTSAGGRDVEVAAACGIDDWVAFVAEVRRRRRAVGGPLTRWSGPCLAAALQLAVIGRTWPADRAAEALLVVATDPKSRSRVRVAEAGPWWDEPADQATDTVEKQRMAAASAEADGLRLELQRRAREQLRAEGLPVTHASVTRGAYELLQQAEAVSAP